MVRARPSLLLLSPPCPCPHSDPFPYPSLLSLLSFLPPSRPVRVFRVKKSEGKEYALKIVVTEENVASMLKEHTTLSRLKENTVVVTVMEMHVSPTGCAGYLMQEVGTSYRDVGMNGKDLASFEALAKLHMSGVVHGDARLENLIFCHDSWKFCDLQLPDDLEPQAMKVMRERDVYSLLKSVCNAQCVEIEKVLIEKYCSAPNVEVVRAILLSQKSRPLDISTRALQGPSPAPSTSCPSSCWSQSSTSSTSITM